MSSNSTTRRAPCDSCGGKLVARQVDLYRRRGALRILFERVPAFVCRECGARVFDAPVVEAMERILSHPPKRMKSRSIAVVSP